MEPLPDRGPPTGWHEKHPKEKNRIWKKFAVAAGIVIAGVSAYQKYDESQNVTFNFQAETKDGYHLTIQAKTPVISRKTIPTEAERAYTRAESADRMQYVLKSINLRDIANDACLLNKGDLIDTFLQEAHGASFSRFDNGFSVRDITGISIPAEEKVQLSSPGCKF